MTVNRIPLRNWSEIEFELAKIRGELDRLGVASEQSSRGWFQQLHVRDRAQFLGVAAGGYLRLDANNYLEQVPAGIGEANTASNVGVGGVGLYNAKVGVDLQFRNINAASARLSVALDAPNNEVDLDVVEAQINHDNLGTRTHDGDTLQLDGVTSNGGAFNFTTSGTLTFSNTVALSTCINAAGDTDKFLVLDGADNVDFRTGAEVLSDIGGAAAVHTHDGDTLQLDAVNSDGGAFSFNTTGAVTFNQDVNTQNLGVTGNITVTGTVDGVDVSDHHARHENGGADEISVAGLSGVLADAQTPAAHVHDGDTLEHDAVNSNGGDFDFTTTGDIRHIVGVGNAFVLTDVVTDDTDKRPAIRAEQYDSTGEPEGFTVIYVEGKA